MKTDSMDELMKEIWEQRDRRSEIEDGGASAGGGRSVTLPVEALSEPDEKEEMVAPEVGDTVNVAVLGKGTAVNGGKATIEIQSANGQEIGGADDEDGGSKVEDGGEGAADQNAADEEYFKNLKE